VTFVTDVISVTEVCASGHTRSLTTWRGILSGTGLG
jgi:hypothetical protein